MTDTYSGDLNVGGTAVTCTGATPHYASGCALLLHYANVDGDIDTGSTIIAINDYNNGIITEDEANFVLDCWSLAFPNVNKKCPGCYTAPCTYTPWVNGACIAVGKRHQTRTCTPAGCDIEEQDINDASCKAIGDITKVTLDNKTLPENGTINWVLNDEAAVRVYFRNTGNVASPFTVTVSYNGTSVGTFTTGSIPADGSEYYINCGSFMPDATGIHHVSTHIEP